MDISSKPSFKLLLVAVPIFLLLVTVTAGSVYAFAPGVLLQVSDGDGFISDVDPTQDDADIRVVELEVGKTDVASQNEIEVEVIVANYGTETKNDVMIKPRLVDMDGNPANDDLVLRPQDQYTIEEFEPGSIQTFTFFAKFEHSPTEQGKDELTYRLQLSDENGGPVENIRASERLINVVPEGSSTSGSQFIDRSAISMSTFSVDSFKDEQISQTNIVGSDMSIPPVKKDESGDISERDVAQGRVNSFGALTQVDTRNAGDITTDDGKLQVGFGFDSIPTKAHYLFRIAHNDPDISEPVELKVVDSTGDEIDLNTSYKIPESDGKIEQFDFHLSSKEVDSIRSQGEAFIVTNITEEGSTSNVEINNIYHLSLIGVNEVVNLPESNITIQDIQPVDNNYEINTNGRPTYNLDDDMEFEVEIKNEGRSSYVDDLELLELSKEYNSARDTRRSEVINPGQTRTFTFDTVADLPGTHEYTVNDRSLCDESLTAGTQCPLYVQVADSGGEIVPSVNPETPTIVAEETTNFDLGGVYSSDYPRINSITWSFDGDEQSYTAQNGVDVQHTFTNPGEKIVSAEVEYQLDGETVTADHRIYVDVVQRPQPDIDAVYYDVKTTDRSTSRTGETWSSGIGGEISSNSCSNVCEGEINIGGISPQMTDGISMMVISKNFGSKSPEIVHYGTYDFDTNQFATTDGSEFNGELEDQLNSGASTQFQNDVTSYSDQGNILVFAGGGDPADDGLENQLTQMGADFGGHGGLSENASYTFITEVTEGSGYAPLHESYLPASTQEPLTHNIEIVPVEASESNVPAGREVYLAVDDANGSDYYEDLNDDQISYSWSGVDDRGEYGYIVPNSDIDVSVDLSIGTISDTDQSDSETVRVEDQEPRATAIASQNIIQEGERTAITAAYSYDTDGKIDSSRYNWNIVDAPEGTDVIPAASGQSFTLQGGDNPGTVDIELTIDGQHTDTTSVQVASEVNADYSVNRIAGLIDYERPVVSPREQVIYSYGSDEGEISVDELQLSRLTTNVQETFGAGTVEFRDNSILMQADARTGTSASRFIQTDTMNLGLYDSIYVAYEREFRRGTSGGSPETGYISMHLGEISEDNFTYGQPASLRGSETSITMTSDVVTEETVNQRYNVMELDVSDVSRSDNVTIHARAHESNSGVTTANIHEIWAGSYDSTGPTSQMFKTNVFPQTTDNVQYTRGRQGLKIVDLGADGPVISSKSFSTSQLDVGYDVVGDGSSNYQIVTNGFDMTSNLNEDVVSTDNPGSEVLISSMPEDRKPFMISGFQASVDRTNTNNPIVQLDARESAALPDDNYRWEAQNPSAVNIRNPNNITTIAEFTEPGSHDITLSVSSPLGSDTYSDTIQVDSVAPEINLQMPSEADIGSSVPIEVASENDVNVEEVLVLLGNTDKQSMNGYGTMEYAYSNPGEYEVTVIARTSDGLTDSATSQITVDTPDIEVGEDSLRTEMILPNDVYFDATGSLDGEVPEDAEPAEVISLRNYIENEDQMNYTWSFDGNTETGENYLHETNSEGTDRIDLKIESPNGVTETMELIVDKVESEPRIVSFGTDKGSISFDEQFNVNYNIQHEVGIDSTVEIDKSDGSTYTNAFSGTTDTTDSISIDTSNRNPGELPDTYTLELTVQDQYGNTDTATTDIEVLPGPTADFEVTDSGPFVVGEAVQFDASQSDEPYGEDLTYDWEFPDGQTVTNTGDATTTQSFNSVGEQQVQLTVTDANGDTDTIDKNVQIITRPSADLDIQKANKSVTYQISNPNSETLEDYAVKINPDHIDGMGSDYSNLAFRHEGTQIPHWVESTADPGTVWISVPTIPGDSSTEVTMYYGESISESQKPNEVFQFFDGFNDGTIGSDWTDMSGATVSEQGGRLTVEEGNIHTQDRLVNQPGMMVETDVEFDSDSVVTNDNSGIMIGDPEHQGGNSGSHANILHIIDNSDSISMWGGDGTSDTYNICAGVPVSNRDLDTPMVLGVADAPQSDEIRAFRDYSTEQNCSGSLTEGGAINFVIGLGHFALSSESETTTAHYDWVRTRQHAENPVSVTVPDSSSEFEDGYIFDATQSTTGGENNSIETYRYDFDGDGNFEREVDNPLVNYEYSQGGIYDAVLEVEDEYGFTDQVTQTINAGEPVDIKANTIRITGTGERTITTDLESIDYIEMTNYQRSEQLDFEYTSGKNNGCNSNENGRAYGVAVPDAPTPKQHSIAMVRNSDSTDGHRAISSSTQIMDYDYVNSDGNTCAEFRAEITSISDGEFTIRVDDYRGSPETLMFRAYDLGSTGEAAIGFEEIGSTGTYNSDTGFSPDVVQTYAGQQVTSANTDNQYLSESHGVSRGFADLNTGEQYSVTTASHSGSTNQHRTSVYEGRSINNIYVGQNAELNGRLIASIHSSGSNGIAFDVSRFDYSTTENILYSAVKLPSNANVELGYNEIQSTQDISNTVSGQIEHIQTATSERVSQMNTEYNSANSGQSCGNSLGMSEGWWSADTARGQHSVGLGRTSSSMNTHRVKVSDSNIIDNPYMQDNQNLCGRLQLSLSSVNNGEFNMNVRSMHTDETMTYMAISNNIDS